MSSFDSLEANASAVQRMTSSGRSWHKKYTTKINLKRGWRNAANKAATANLNTTVADILHNFKENYLYWLRISVNCPGILFYRAWWTKLILALLRYVPVIVCGLTERNKRQLNCKEFFNQTCTKDCKERLTIMVCCLSLYLNWNKGSVAVCGYAMKLHCLATKRKGNTHFIVLMAMFHFHFRLFILLLRYMPH